MRAKKNTEEKKGIFWEEAESKKKMKKSKKYSEKYLQKESLYVSISFGHFESVVIGIYMAPWSSG